MHKLIWAYSVDLYTLNNELMEHFSRPDFSHYLGQAADYTLDGKWHKLVSTRFICFCMYLNGWQNFFNHTRRLWRKLENCYQTELQNYSWKNTILKIDSQHTYNVNIVNVEFSQKYFRNQCCSKFAHNFRLY